ncbi:unnamed protein product [Rotaria sordida]|uniref:Uncharacterized protein n=1 Tax=Rotaria sordida TaxID=392033 RepID=A0A814HEX5_9BILA|nr:unnamed protein product [Rotaria sordida]
MSSTTTSKKTVYEKSGTVRVTKTGIRKTFTKNRWRCLCSVDKCEKQAQRVGLCARHLRNKQFQQPLIETIEKFHQSSINLTTGEHTVLSHSPIKASSYTDETMGSDTLHKDETIETKVIKECSIDQNIEANSIRKETISSYYHIASNHKMDIDSSAITTMTSDTSVDASERTIEQQHSPVNTNKCQYWVPFSDIYQCRELSTYHCFHCSSSFCLPHGVQHQWNLKEEINHLLTETKKLLNSIPQLNIISGKENCKILIDQWAAAMHAKINQKHYELEAELNCYEQQIETNQDQWKKSLENRLTTKIGCKLEEQLQKYEVNGMEFKKACHELEHVRELFYLFNSKPLISVTHNDDNQINLNEPCLVFETNIKSGIDWMKDLSSDNNIDTMNHISVRQFPDSETNHSLESIISAASLFHYHHYQLVQIIDNNKNNCELNLRYKALTDQDMKNMVAYGIQNNRTLTTLDLSHNQIGPTGAKYLSDALRINTVLTTLILVWNDIRSEGAQHLGDLLRVNTTLTTLDLSHNEIGLQGTQNLSDALRINTTLTTLDLSSNQIGPQGVQYLSDALQTNTALTTLNISWNEIGVQGTQHLSDALRITTTLTTLILCGNQIGSQGIQHLSNTLHSNTTLTTLNLARNYIKCDSIQYLSDALGINKTLTALDLSHNRSRRQGLQYLSNALRINKTLTILDLSGNQIGNQGIQYISDTLRINILTILDLSHNQIQSQGAQYLSDVLRINTTLIRLNLSWNRIGIQGAQYLSDALRTNKTLTTLDLSHNQIGSQGTQYLCDALRINTTLATLYLSDNQIGFQAVQYLSDVFRTNTTLIKLNLSRNQIGVQERKCLIELSFINKNLDIVW